MTLPSLLLQLSEHIPWLEDVQVRTTYMGCAIVGGAILSLQMILMMFGGDMDADTDVDDLGGDSDGLGFLSIRSMAAFLTFFGLTGLMGLEEGWGGGRTVAVALGTGTTSMLLVAWLMATFARLTSDGNVDPNNAVGQNARVYLRIPGESSGKGKITVSIQGRSQEFGATTKGPELATGSEVRVLLQTSPNTFEVEAL